MKLKFCGGAQFVTGANYLVTLKNNVSFLVDCGLAQGSRFAEESNFETFPYDPVEIKAVFITHAHIDHTGRLPKLVKNGFKSKIYSTKATRDFGLLVLEDSERVLEKEAKELKREKIYELKDVKNLAPLWQGLDYYQTFEPLANVKATFFNAGHILGSAFILFEIKEGSETKKIIFSGDLGNPPDPLLKPTDKIPAAEFCLIESAYGDRIHEDEKKRREKLQNAIEKTILKNGNVIIPAFALERSQEIIFEIENLIKEKRLPSIPIFLDSPLSIKATQIYQNYWQDYNDAAKEFSHRGKQLFNFKNLKMTLTKEESKAINELPPPKIIIAGSGMSQGGRIIHHELRYLPDPKSTLLIVGYQSQGSLGRKLLEGEKQIKIMGEIIPVRASITAIGGYSSHADQNQLINWLAPDSNYLKSVFVVQGEEKPSEILAQKITQELKVRAFVPKPMEEIEF